MIELKQALTSGDEAVQTICKTISQLKATNDRTPTATDAIRILINELADQSAGLLTAWHGMHADAQMQIQKLAEANATKAPDPTVKPAPVIPAKTAPAKAPIVATTVPAAVVPKPTA